MQPVSTNDDDVEMDNMVGGSTRVTEQSSGVNVLTQKLNILLALLLTTFVIAFVALLLQITAVKDDPVEVDTGDASGLPGMETISWDNIESLAQTSELNFYLWSPEGTSPRGWVDNYLTPELSSKYGITVNRIDAVYTGCDTSGMALVCDVADEVASGLTNDGGAVDLVWINGANFAAMKEAGTLYGPFASLLPNAINFDFTDTAISHDRGVAIDNMEFPFNTAQSVFIHDEANVPTPPTTIPDLVDWIIANPGRFAYGDATTDFTGATFVRLMFYHYGGDAVGSFTDLFGDFNEDLYTARAPAVWAALNSIEDSLYQPNGTVWYPQSRADSIVPLVADGTLWLDFSMQASEASTQIQDDINPWPETMQAYVLDEPGTIADTNYLAIPVNAQNKPAALTAINHIASQGSMFTRSTPEVWGALQAFDPFADTMLDWDAAFDYILTHEATPTVEELASAKLGDLSSDWVNRINEDWATFVRDA